MVEGSSLNHITLLKEKGDTLKGTFLNLQPELWNSEGNVLTLWLDPGRIKRDLIPNKELGTPLKAGERYILRVRQSWSGKNGKLLLKEYTRTFVTTVRDADPPVLSVWRIDAPRAGKIDTLEIHFHQPLDYFLAKETIFIKNAVGDVVPGDIEVGNEEKILKFVPEQPWQPGKFTLYAEGRLEDLSGNNLNRPFDRNVDAGRPGEQKFFTKEFVVR